MEEKTIFEGNYIVKTNGTIVANGLRPLRLYPFNGYFTISYKNKTYYLHRLIASAFIPNPNNDPCINHIDGHKENNCVDNLEWCTWSYNNKHAYKMGLKHPAIKTRKHKTVVMLNNDKEEVHTFFKMNDADKFFGKRISANIHYAIKTGTKARGYYWKYKIGE